jgi:transmembrane sensor
MAPTEGTLPPTGGHDDDLDFVALDRFFAGDSTEAEAARIQAWVRAKPGRAAEVERLRKLWRAGAGPVPDVEAALKRVTKREAATTGSRGDRARRPSRPVIWAGEYGARRRTVWWARVSVAAASIALAVSLGVLIRARTSTVSIAIAQEYVAAPGERRNVTLPDGTQFALAPASRLRVMGGYGGVKRDVSLEGEAFFRVVHDGARPFRVLARNAWTTDVGTAFDVRAYAGDTSVQVAVADGRVDIAAVGEERNAHSLGRGDVARVSTGGVITPLPAGDLSAAIGWTRGELVFRDVPLRDVVPVLERWYGVSIVVADSTLGRRPVIATYDMQSMAEVLASVTFTVGAHYTQVGRTITIVPGVTAAR